MHSNPFYLIILHTLSTSNTINFLCNVLNIFLNFPYKIYSLLVFFFFVFFQSSSSSYSSFLYILSKSSFFHFSPFFTIPSLPIFYLLSHLPITLIYLSFSFITNLLPLILASYAKSYNSSYNLSYISYYLTSFLTPPF